MRAYPAHKKRLDHPMVVASNFERIDAALHPLMEALWRLGFETSECCQEWSDGTCDCPTCIGSTASTGVAYIKFRYPHEAERFVNSFASGYGVQGQDETFAVFYTDKISAVTAAVLEYEGKESK